MLIKTGIPTKEDIEGITPSKERRQKGPVAVIECYQEIPCNPCYIACKFGAIKEFEDINQRPILDFELCTGCGQCVIKCPGLAIFIIDENYSDTEALVQIPYEFLPLPEKNTFVTGLDREGKPICRARVMKVRKGKGLNKTSTVTLTIPKRYTMDVRSFNIEDYFSDNTMICRCESVTLGEVRELIRQGYKTIDEIKRISRAGMGSCQGRTCRHLIMQEIAKATGQNMADMPMSTFRPPTKPINLGMVAGGGDDE
ncbi:(2Fe-2S)-binding protein [Clostridium sp. Cult3]|uniref:(2Fe-2S)-binding protein n=1 Tax=Clostridium sp. Cult3 TaxID=2079004 RepID=UPI0030134D5C|nr:(2Fe-2S)-binding protein [Clostridium sp. Cult3]